MSGSGGGHETSSSEERWNADYQKEIPTVKLINTYRGGGESAGGLFTVHTSSVKKKRRRERERKRERERGRERERERGRERDR